MIYIYIKVLHTYLLLMMGHLLQSTHLIADSGELLQIPPGYLDDAVVEAGLEAGGGGVGDRVTEQGQGPAQGQLGCHIG